MALATMLEWCSNKEAELADSLLGVTHLKLDQTRLPEEMFISGKTR